LSRFVIKNIHLLSKYKVSTVKFYIKSTYDTVKALNIKNRQSLCQKSI